MSQARQFPSRRGDRLYYPCGRVTDLNGDPVPAHENAAMPAEPAAAPIPIVPASFAPAFATVPVFSISRTGRPSAEQERILKPTGGAQRLRRSE